MKANQQLQEMVASWEGYDDQLSTAENFIELQIEMGFLDDAREVIAQVSKKEDN